MFHLNGNYKINQFTYVSHQIKLLQTTYLYIIYSPVYSITDTTKHEDSKSEAQIKHQGFHQVQCTNLDQTMLNETDNVAHDDTTDEGWQQVVPEGRSLTARKSASSMSPT